MRDLEAVAEAHAGAAEEELVVRIRIIETDPVDEEERLVGIGAPQKDRSDAAGRT